MSVLKSLMSGSSVHWKSSSLPNLLAFVDYKRELTLGKTHSGLLVLDVVENTT